jgi:diguanylate cyclase (GGDEF)-like protein
MELFLGKGLCIMANNKLTIGVIARHMEGALNGRIIAGIHHYLQPLQARMIAIRTMYSNKVNYPRYDNPLALGVADGWIVINDVAESSYLIKLHELGIPVVSANRLVDVIPCASILTDNYKGMYTSTEHLIHHGHRRIAFIGDLGNPNMRIRLEGYLQALKVYGIEQDPQLIVDSKTFNYAGGYQAAEKLLHQAVAFTSVVAASDMNAIGILEKLKSVGLRVPTDIAVIGFNDIPYAATIGLTTMFHPGYEMGRKAAELLIRKIQGEPFVSEKHVIPCELVSRTSCGCSLDRETPVVEMADGANVNFVQHMVENYQEIGSNLLRYGHINLQDLSWMANSNVSCLALWKEDPASNPVLEIDQHYDRREGKSCLAGALFPGEQFPPEELFKNEFGGSDSILVHIIRTHRREWGLLALTGSSFIDQTNERLSVSMMAHVLDSLAAILERDDLLLESRAASEQISYLAYHDPLTGLLNRTALSERIPLLLENAEDSGASIAFILLDLDRFKMINDSYGHLLGDQLLIQVTERLRKLPLDMNCLFRLGGDEFVIVLPQIEDKEEVVRLGEQILTLLQPVFLLERSEFYISGSLGISIFPDNGQNMTELIKHADIAMYRAKAKGKNQLEVFHSDMDIRTKHMLEMDNGIRKALTNNELQLYYQPQIDVMTGKLFGFEALIRWFSPERGIVSPVEFIPVAEETGQIIYIGEWVLREACKQMKKWRMKGGEWMKCSVNISGRQFEQRDFVDRLRFILAELDVDPRSLCLEITESIAIQDVEFCLAQLHDLNELGISIALDDFGTGYSSLVLLKQLPIQYVKIDRSFISHMASTSEDKAIVQGIVSLTHSLGMQVIAEGVEDAEQLHCLHSMGCDYFQGFLTSPPVPAEEFDSLFF